MLWFGDVVFAPFEDGVCGLLPVCGDGAGDPAATVNGAGSAGGGVIAVGLWLSRF